MNSKQDVRLGLLEKNDTQAIADEILKNLKTGMTLQDATGVSDETLEEIYSLAYSYYDQGKYKESACLFQFLTGVCPKTYKYVMGFAASYHQLKIYAEAAAGFYIAFNIEPSNPEPAYYVMDCFLKQNLLEEAKEFANVTILVCDKRPEFQDLKNRCELIIKSLKVNKK